MKEKILFNKSFGSTVFSKWKEKYQTNDINKKKD